MIESVDFRSNSYGLVYDSGFVKVTKDKHNVFFSTDNLKQYEIEFIQQYVIKTIDDIYSLIDLIMNNKIPEPIEVPSDEQRIIEIFNNNNPIQIIFNIKIIPKSSILIIKILIK